MEAVALNVLCIRHLTASVYLKVYPVNMHMATTWIIHICVQLLALVCSDDNQENKMESDITIWTSKDLRDSDVEIKPCPFWANRGRRKMTKRLQEIIPSALNSYSSSRASTSDSEWNMRLEEPLYAEEPRWILMRRDDESRTSRFRSNFLPYFVTRGKRFHWAFGPGIPSRRQHSLNKNGLRKCEALQLTIYH